VAQVNVLEEFIIINDRAQKFYKSYIKKKREAKSKMKQRLVLVPVITTLNSRQCKSIWHMAQQVIKNAGTTPILVIPADTIGG
jgi:site-specific recombinase XerD